jgi:hypothetical protein
LYWTKECKLSIEDVIIEIDKDHYDVLISKKIISASGDFINISFLDEQFLEYQESIKEQSAKGIIGNLKRWHSDIYNQYESKKISLEQAIELSKKPIATQSLPDSPPILTQSLIIADKIREEEDKNRLDKIREEQKRLEESNTDVSASTNPPPVPKIDYEKLKLFFNANRGNLPELKVLTEKRKKQIKSIQEQYGKEMMIVAIEKAKESDFLQGRTPSGWKASFDWIINPTNFIKIIEDNYLNDGRTKPKPTSEKSNTEIFSDGMQSGWAKDIRFKL